MTETQTLWIPSELKEHLPSLKGVSVDMRGVLKMIPESMFQETFGMLMHGHIPTSLFPKDIITNYRMYREESARLFYLRGAYDLPDLEEFRYERWRGSEAMEEPIYQFVEREFGIKGQIQIVIPNYRQNGSISPNVSIIDFRGIPLDNLANLPMLEIPTGFYKKGSPNETYWKIFTLDGTKSENNPDNFDIDYLPDFLDEMIGEDLANEYVSEDAPIVVNAILANRV